MGSRQFSDNFGNVEFKKFYRFYRFSEIEKLCPLFSYIWKHMYAHDLHVVRIPRLYPPEAVHVRTPAHQKYPCSPEALFPGLCPPEAVLPDPP